MEPDWISQARALLPKAPELSVRPLQRAGRLRFSWFIIGTLCGSIVTSLILHQFVLPGLLQEARKELKQPLAETAEVAPLPQVKNDPKEAEKPKLVLPTTLAVTIKRGQTLGSLLSDYGVSAEESQKLADGLRPVFNLRRLSPQHKLEISLDKGQKTRATVTGLTIKVNELRTVKVGRDGDKFTVKTIEAPIEKAIVRAGGKITSSLYQTGVNAGIPASMLAEIIKAFSYEIDFQRDIHDGDKLDVIYERKQTKTGVSADSGDLLYAAITTRGKEKSIYRYRDKGGVSGWYTTKGESIRKALLRTPINGARITSKFGMRRHPIQGYSKMHRGVDFGAPTGTPIYAAGDGIVKEAGRKGGYGNYVRIQHSGKYATAYAHASRIARGIRGGAKVKQGQVIAYVGSTGNSTGPHLHYEVHVNGAQVNPSGVQFKYGTALAGKDLKKFKSQIGHVQKALKKVGMNKAMTLAELEKK